MNQLPNDFFVLDTETTGLGEQDEIIEIAIINHHGEAVLNTLIKPVQKIPTETTKTHGITNAMVAKAPTWPMIYPKAKKILQSAEVFIYNATFDIRLLKQTSTVTNKPSFDFESHCVMKMVAERINDFHRISLTKSANYYKIRFGELKPHRAVSDCAVALDVLGAMHGMPAINTGVFARNYEVVV